MIKKIITTFLITIAGLFFLAQPAPVFAADDGCVNTIILGGDSHQVCDTNGDSIYALLRLAVEIMTIGVGILGVIGIGVTGIQYLTAGGNEEKTRKAKRRMFEIIIGLAIYATFFLLMQWLVKDFEIKDASFDSSGGSSSESSSGDSNKSSDKSSNKSSDKKSSDSPEDATDELSQ